jgi:hypothetical protein
MAPPMGKRTMFFYSLRRCMKILWQRLVKSGNNGAALQNINRSRAGLADLGTPLL